VDENLAEAHAYVVHADGTGLTDLGPAEVAAGGSGPAWSPDGMRIAFAHGVETIYLVNRDGTSLQSFGPGFLPAWSPDGSRLLFTRIRAGNVEVYVGDVAGTWRSRVTVNPQTDQLPLWRP
jgi:TolB protein